MNRFVDPRQWDFLNIWFNIIASFIVIWVLKWWNAYGKLKKWWTQRRHINRYSAALRAECTFLIVIGRRKGFTLPEVYVPLDIAPSSLGAKSETSRHQRVDRIISYVLVGGPGAGKSTTVKKIILNTLAQKEKFPLLLRLRDYVGFESIEAFIRSKLHASGFSEDNKIATDYLLLGKCVCVLDGLDEVRPSLRHKTIGDINGFYHRYFTKLENELIVTCRKEAYRSVPLDIPAIMEVRPLTDEQIQRFAKTWPPGYPTDKSAITFWRDVASTPSILELARSPLLLVGGLVQYTESNAGVPEERYEYLARVAKWLVVEWATAQGHPPDPYRSVYDRMLSKLAYMLHRQKANELKREDVEKCFSEWLPQFGFAAESAREVLDAITTKTGILISEDKNFVVFAQFGLQEYFASLEVVEALGPNKISRLEPIEWWREVILLAVAQQREPTAIATLLFESSPLVAAAAVAECPTPSVALQELAIAACLKQLDQEEERVASALIPLLRKVKGPLEVKLCEELDKRLLTNTSRASIVGVCLATAGTAAATTTLAKHPEIWEKCLAEAGYLSASFENLLVNWIREGTEMQSQKAGDLIAARLSFDRLYQLLELLPKLPPSRSSRLAVLILAYGRNALRLPNDWDNDLPLAIVARCLPYITDRGKYIAERCAEQQTVRKSFLSADVMSARGLSVGLAPDGLAGVCLFLEKGKGRRYSEQQIFNTVRDSILWSRYRARYFLLGIAGGFVSVVGVAITEFGWKVELMVGLVLLCVVIAVTQDASGVSWRHVRRMREMRFVTASVLTLLGVVGAFDVIWFDNIMVRGQLHLVFGMLLVILAWFARSGEDSYYIVGFLFNENGEHSVDRSRERSFLCSNIIPICFFMFLAGVLMLQRQFPSEKFGSSDSVRCIAGIMEIWAFLAFLVFGIGHYRVSVARAKCDEYIRTVVDKGSDD